MGKRQENSAIKKSFCANQEVDSVVVVSDIHSSQNRHHKKLIKYSFVLQTKMSCVYVMHDVLSLLVCWILQALCPMLAKHAEVKVNATDDGFKLTVCPR